MPKKLGRAGTEARQCLQPFAQGEIDFRWTIVPADGAGAANWTSGDPGTSSFF